MKKTLKKMGASLVEALFMALALVAGILLSAAMFVWYLIPKWKKQEADATAQKVAGMKAAIQKAHETRNVDTQAAVAEIEKKTDEMRAADTVDLANDLILKG